MAYIMIGIVSNLHYWPKIIIFGLVTKTNLYYLSCSYGMYELFD